MNGVRSTNLKNAEKQRLEKRQIPDFVLNNIEAKFFSSQAFQNPMENITEVMKQIEQAHWHTREYYVDQKRMKGITFRKEVSSAEITYPINCKGSEEAGLVHDLIKEFENR